MTAIIRYDKNSPKISLRLLLNQEEAGANNLHEDFIFKRIILRFQNIDIHIYVYIILYLYFCPPPLKVYQSSYITSSPLPHQPPPPLQHSLLASNKTSLSCTFPARRS